MFKSCKQFVASNHQKLVIKKSFFTKSRLLSYFCLIKIRANCSKQSAATSVILCRCASETNVFHRIIEKSKTNNLLVTSKTKPRILQFTNSLIHESTGCGISLRTVGVASKPVQPRPLPFAGFFIYVKRKFVANLKVIGSLMWK